MFRHCVVFTFADDATPEQKEAALDAVAALPDHIPEIAAYSVGFDAGLREDNADMAAVGDFADQADYEVYAAHPEHVRVVQDLIRPILASRAAIQFEY